MGKRKSTGPMFKIGDEVRVKPGIIDPTYPDISLGGWKGVVIKVMYVTRPRYIVQWSPQTLANAPAIYRERCERDGNDYDAMWMKQTDLEPDSDTSGE